MDFLRRTTHLAAAALAVAASVAATLATAAPVAAHPLGVPQTLRIAAEGDQVQIRWSAAADDLTALGLQLGVLADARTFVYDRGVLVPEESDASDATLLAEAPQLRRYLLGHIQVSQDGQRCSGEVTTTRGLAEDGTALLVFACPRKVEQVTVDVSTLTDLHPAYRTLATGDGGQRATYTLETPAHQWRLGTTADPLARLSSPIAALGVLVAGAGGSYVVMRRRRAAKLGAPR